MAVETLRKNVERLQNIKKKKKEKHKEALEQSELQRMADQ